MSYWKLYVLNDDYQSKINVFCSDIFIDSYFLGNFVQSIVIYNAIFKKFIKGDEKNSFKIVGYARKSPGKKDKEKRARL